MNINKFIQLSKKGETFQVEFKTCYERISESVYESICSFLNHSGGYILLGVNDNGQIKGVNPKMSEIDENNVRDNPKMSEIDNKKVRDKNKRHRAIISLIKEKPNITIDILSEKLDVNEKTIRRDISQLKALGIIERQGGDYGGSWIVKQL